MAADNPAGVIWLNYNPQALSAATPINMPVIRATTAAEGCRAGPTGQLVVG